MSHRKRMTWASLIASGILLVFFLAGVYVPGLVGLAGTFAWVLRALLWALGAAASLLVFLYLRAWAKRVPDVAPADEEVDAAVGAVRRRLPKGTKLGGTPVVLVLGPRGSAKTTTVLHSGLDPDLLAGEARSAAGTVPTEIANFWLASGTVLAEAGGGLLDDQARWLRLLRHLRPGRLAAVLGRGRQAPRLAVVCFACDELVRPAGQDSIVAAAQTLRARLLDAAQVLGVSLPVYVVFTRADSVPYFTDYVRSFGREEASDVLGATFPLRPVGDPARYREAELKRAGRAFERIVRTLSLRRLDVLGREAAGDLRAGAYEFPRALRKVSGPAARFLVELGRPPQAGPGPFVRGFYFTGVRPVIVREERAAERRAVPGVSAVGATSVFDPRALLAQAQHAGAPAGSESRRVPDWTFLPRLFRDVVLADRVAMAVTGIGDRVNLLRRLALVAALAGTLLATGAFLVSFVANRGLVSQARGVAAGVQGVDLTGLGLPPVEDLGRLDDVRAVADRLRGWEAGRRPLRYRWGLYRGDVVLAELRRVYFNRFAPMLWDGTRERLDAALWALPEAPTAAGDYTSTYEALRAYLIATDHPEYSTAEFMTPVLMRHWRGAREVDEDRARLARLQFSFFASELPHGTPYRVRPDPALVDRTRGYLAMFGETDRLYQALLEDASRQAPPVAFSQAVPGSEAVLRADQIVPGAFTAAGWEFVQAEVAAANLDRLFASDVWVLGERTVSPADRARLAVELRQRYEREYIEAWTRFVASAVVPAYTSAQDAARKLERLSHAESPLLRLLAIAATHTAVDTTVVGPAFQPIHALVPPDADRPVQPSNEQYVSGLSQLYQTMTQVASTQGAARQSAAQQAQADADRIAGTIRQIAQGFTVEGGARNVGEAVQSLLRQPLIRLQPVVAQLPLAETNRLGSDFCARFAPVIAKYPFTQHANVEATVDEVNAAFQPGASALSTLLDGVRHLLVREGREWRPRPGAEQTPTPAFLAMLNRAVRISESLYPADATGPTVEFTARPAPTDLFPEIMVTIDGRSNRVTRTDFQQRSFEWRATGAREARISAQIGAAPMRELFAYGGTWSAFRLFGRAAWTPQAAGTYRLSWEDTGAGDVLMADLGFLDGTPIFNPELIGGLGPCVSTIVR